METNEIMLLQDELNGYKFKEFLNSINDSYKSYFESRVDDRKDIHKCFALLENNRPPSIRLRYLKQSDINEQILNLVITKYKEMFGEYADYQIIEN